MNNVAIVLLVVLLLFFVGALPLWSHAGFGYGYYPSGLFGLVLLILVILLLMGKL